ncbi:protein SHQ1 homolog [Pararge aegeria]|uniref:Protein SHQ1 homolog n=3 Tax=Pararge aegeria TaxID=116150 RepID=A0A8S4S7P1_9NEOP|nr:protein SHQ1 homolog [Pararge aegeria]CAH2248837.1 jg7547 [Pararge aegeria aegeria]
MLTPRFKLAQDENRVYITVHAPYTNIGETEIDVDGENVLFVSAPYFLRLRLPGRIVENDLSKGSYCCDSGDFKLVFEKETPGEHFENLDMITSLLAPRDIPDINPNLVEMLEEDGVTIEQEDSEDDDGDDAILGCQYPFGFANSILTEFKEIGTEFPQIFELRVPELVPVNKRNTLREQYEEHKFSSDHYLADYFDKELLAPYLNATMAWVSPDFDQNIDFTEEEVSILKELPNKHYILTKAKCGQVFYGLIDILFGYCYDKRTTLNDSNVESSWTINKLSATLSWFCVFNDMKEVLIACYRRALSYPIFRNFDLCNKIKNDLASLLRKGKKFVIKCVISIYQMFNLSNDARYILNQLYIKDYLIFLQKCRAEKFEELGNNIANINITKNDLSLEIVELEVAAVMVQQEESQIMENEMAVQMASMSLLPGLKKLSDFIIDDDSDSSDSSSSDSSSDSSDDTSDLDSDDEPS